MIPAPDIRDYLSYDPETGVFLWIKRPPYANRVKTGVVAGNVWKDGYRTIMFRGRKHQAHRIAWWWVHGVWPPSDLDHKDLDKDNNRIGNLRLATDSQNQANAGPPRHNTSGFKGVYFKKREGRWVAAIGVGGIKRYLGYFDTAADAARAYDAAAHQHFREFARTNFSMKKREDDDARMDGRGKGDAETTGERAVADDP
jgi:hypothetical protein